MSEPKFYDRDLVTMSISIEAAAEAPRVYVALGTVGFIARALMHYVPELHRSVPHHEPTCAWCKYPSVPKCWFPVQRCPLHFNSDCLKQDRLKIVPRSLPLFSSWPAKVLEVPPSAVALLTALNPGDLFAVVRGKGNQKKAVAFKVFDQTVENILPPFDCIPFLRKAWGLVDRPTFGEN